MVGLSPQSPFVRAFYDYVQALPEKKNQNSILSRIDINDPSSPEKVQDAMRQIEMQHGEKTSIKMMKRVMGPFVAVLKDYYGILDTLCQADPTPGMVLWGYLKIVIDSMGRFVDLFDKLKAEILSMTTQIRRLALYDNLYGQSPDMQEALFQSYKDIFRFWCRVDKECKRCSLNSLLRASTSISLKKLQAIQNDLREDADQIDKLVPILEGQFASQERLAASSERHENKKEREEGSAWRKQLQSDRIQSWLGGQLIAASNSRRHTNNVAISKKGISCDWLLVDPKFQRWTGTTAANPILWLFAGPGSGKSVLCSQVVEYIQARDEKSATAFHFYEFDNQRTALSTAQILASQLFEKYWLLHQDIPEDLQITSQKSNASLSNVQDFIKLLVMKLPMTYFFLDGLDEETHEVRWTEMEKTIDFISLLAGAYPDSIRVWYSTQDRFIIRKKLDSFPSLDIKGRIKDAVDQYISLTVPGINNPDVDETTLDWMLTELRKRADGNFLWATLMLKTIENEVSSFDEMEHFVRKGLPHDLYSYYRRIFTQYQARERELASQVFSLITFAKRRLRMTELREAIGMLGSGNSRSLRTKSIPWRQAVEKLFSPLIEMQQDPEDPQDCFCHLFHSTVKDFLHDNPDILSSGHPSEGGCLISEAVIGNACLQYLQQKRYAQYLRKSNGDWATASGESVKGHHLMTYAAKYWDRHLDGIEAPPLALRQETENFLTSSHFITTLQIQSLFVEGRFWIYTLEGCSTNHKYTKCVFPKWVDSSKQDEYNSMTKNYRKFIAEWNTLLHVATCKNIECCSAGFPGELDRCLWKALGPTNFLSQSQGRYTNFILICQEKPSIEKKAPYIEGVAMDGNEVVVLQLSSQDSSCEVRPLGALANWSLTDNDAPKMRNEATLSVVPEITEGTSPSTDSVDKRDLAKIKIVSFTANLEYVRIASRIFSRFNRSDYVAIGSLGSIWKDPTACFEDIASRGSYLVMASRQKIPAKNDRRGRAEGRTPEIQILNDEENSTHRPGQEHTNCPHCSREPSRSNPGSESSPTKETSGAVAESSDESSSPSTSDGSENCDSVEESWSEGSTEPTDDEKILWKTMESSEADSGSQTQSEDESAKSEDETSSEPPAHSHGQLQQESDSEGGDFDLDSESYDDAYEGDSDHSSYGETSDDNIYDSDEDEPRRRTYVSRRRKAEKSFEKGTLVVYDLESGDASQIFKFVHPLPIMLYESPPVIHPNKSLVVWPLCGGELLFADFEGKTYFIRKARPTTNKTRHLSIQCHFSDCGKFLHMVSFEAHQQALTKSERKAKAKPSLSISAFITTHRLSTRKTSRSPPILVHRAKVSLGSTQSLSHTRMPAEVTWAAEEVFLSSSSESNHLVVFQIKLFSVPKSENDEPSTVSVPRKIILLPESARSRSVHFYPPKPNSNYALILIGSWAAKPKDESKTSQNDEMSEWDSVQGLPETTSPPIGFYVDEDKDLGGWGPSTALVEIRPETEKGMLKPKMERFVGEDDCGDLETYFFA